jgi:hypothetical protein
MPIEARLWVARSATADLRASVWSPHEASLSGDKIVGEVTAPEKGHLAFFGEVDYRIDGLRYHLSTQVRMTD